MMRRRFETFLALRYLRSKRKEVFISIITIISVLGVAVSVVVLNIVLSVMTGFEEELQSKLLDASAHIIIRQYGGEMEDAKAVMEKVKKVPEVVAAFPFTMNQALISNDSGARGVLIRGVADLPEPREKLGKLLGDQKAVDVLFHPPKIRVERPDGESNEVRLPALIVGKALRDKLGLLPGTPVSLLSPQMSSSPQGLVPKMKRFLVVDSYASGLVEYESGLAYASMEDAQAFFGLGSTVSGLEVTVSDLMRAKLVSTSILSALGGSNAPYSATDWTEPNKPLWDAIRLEKRVYFIVLLLLILVASFSIVSTLIMVVMEKSRDIAILKTMGASDSKILRVFILQGAIIGVSGIILGTILGYLGCVGLRVYGFPLDEAVFSLRQVPVHMKIENFIAVAIAAFFITVFAGVYPARRAARLRPADALRFE